MKLCETCLVASAGDVLEAKHCKMQPEKGKDITKTKLYIPSVKWSLLSVSEIIAPPAHECWKDGDRGNWPNGNWRS
jgi:hypothetical protein